MINEKINIEEKIVELITPIVPIVRNGALERELPYATYIVQNTVLTDKDGIYAIRYNIDIYSAAKTFKKRLEIDNKITERRLAFGEQYMLADCAREDTMDEQFNSYGQHSFNLTINN